MSAVDIGRDPSNTIVLDHPSVSRRHLSVTWNGAAHVLNDLGSSNGTKLNGVTVSRATEIANGSDIEVGQCRFRYEFAAAKKAEVSQTERSGAQPANSSANRGCLPDLNLFASGASGFMPAIVRLFPWILVVLFCLVVVGLLGKIIPLAAGLIPHRTEQSKPHEPPQTPPQTTDENSTDAKIDIIETRTSNTVQGVVLLIKWRNRSTTDITSIDADIDVVDTSGEKVLELKQVPMYRGASVRPDEVHDPSLREGIALPMGTAGNKYVVRPISVK
jgi:hypothetical protein